MARSLEKMASIDAQLRLLAPGKVSEDDKLIEYDALLLDRFIDVLQNLLLKGCKCVIMELDQEDQNVEEVEILYTLDREPSTEFPLRETRLYRTRFPGAVRQKAYRFDGIGGYFNKE